jgi:outer membrane lipoprotein-sorting protein
MNRSKLNILFSLLLILGLASCEQQGPAEEAGENVDEAVNEMQDRYDEASDAAGDAAEEVGDDLSEARDAVSDAAEDMGNQIEDACENAMEGLNAENTDC